MGEQKLTPAERKSISDSFYKWEEEEIGEGRHEMFHRQMEELGKKYLE
jgi:hypothetical protein